MKELCKYYGKVNRLIHPPGDSYVTIRNTTTNEECDAIISTKILLEKGIDHDGCEFQVLIQESIDGKIKGVLSKIEPKKLSKEQVEDIKKNSGDDGLFEI